MSKEIKFGRFLLRNCRMTYEDARWACWRYEGKIYDTDEIFEVFLKTLA